MSSDYKSQLEMLQSMTPAQRKVHFQSEKVQMEVSWLKFMIDSLKDSDEQFEFFKSRAKSAYWDYENLKDEDALDRAEQYIALAESTKSDRYTLKQIREQRARVQWEKQKLSQMTKPATEQSPSSSH